MIPHFFLYLQWKLADMTKHFILHLNPFSTRRFAHRERGRVAGNVKTQLVFIQSCKSWRSNTRHVSTTWRETTSFHSMSYSHHAKTISLGVLVISVSIQLMRLWVFTFVFTQCKQTLRTIQTHQESWHEKSTFLFVSHHHLIVGWFKLYPHRASASTLASTLVLDTLYARELITLPPFPSATMYANTSGNASGNTSVDADAWCG